MTVLKGSPRWLEREASLHLRAREEMKQAFPELPEDDDFFVGSIEGETDFLPMVDRVLEQRLVLLAEAEALDAVIEKLKERAGRKRHRADMIKARLHRVMETIGEKKIDRPAGTLSVRKKGQASVMIIQPEKVPAKYMVAPEPPPPKPDKRALAAALKDPEARQELDGIVVLGNDETILVIS